MQCCQHEQDTQAARSIEISPKDVTWLFKSITQSVNQSINTGQPHPNLLAFPYTQAPLPPHPVFTSEGRILAEPSIPTTLGLRLLYRAAIKWNKAVCNRQCVRSRCLHDLLQADHWRNVWSFICLFCFVFTTFLSYRFYFLDFFLSCLFNHYLLDYCASSVQQAFLDSTPLILHNRNSDLNVQILVVSIKLGIKVKMNNEPLEEWVK